MIPDIDWLAVSGDADNSWYGPGPVLVNLRTWMEQLQSDGHYKLVAATYAAAKVALPHWESWLARSPDVAIESILDGQPPTSQLAAVSRWLNAPNDENKRLALETVDRTKQLHWFDEEFKDAWFQEPGMWAVESSEHCVLSLTGDPYASVSLAALATIAVSCAVNSFWGSAEQSIRDSLSTVVNAIRSELEQL